MVNKDAWGEGRAKQRKDRWVISLCLMTGSRISVSGHFVATTKKVQMVHTCMHISF